jgi:carboxyl-terminal processing protease
LNKSRGVIFGLISLVIVTAVTTFFFTTVVFFGWGGLNNRYNITFDKKDVKKENVIKFNQVKSILSEKYYENVNQNSLLEGAVSGMTNSLKDPYTVYFTKEQMAQFNEKTEGGYVGIGISVVMDNSGILNIVEAFEESPAEKAGMQKGDKIIKVDGKDVTSIKDEDMIIQMIRGKEGSTVKITVYRESAEKSLDFEVERRKIKVTNITHKMLANKIGYIKIIMFDSDVADYFEKYVDELLEKGMKGLIIDVRDNPGGSYEQVVRIADRLLPKGLIVYTEDKQKRKEEQMSDSRELNLPITVLVNGNSASASEVLSGALKDHKKAVLIGTKTFGKGLVQEVYQLDDGSGLKLTLARYFTPAGKCIQGIGISPDIEVLPLEKYKDSAVSEIPEKDDVQLQKEVSYLNEEIAG